MNGCTTFCVPRSVQIWSDARVMLDLAATQRLDKGSLHNAKKNKWRTCAELNVYLLSGSDSWPWTKAVQKFVIQNRYLNCSLEFLSRKRFTNSVQPMPQTQLR